MSGLVEFVYAVDGEGAAGGFVDFDDGAAEVDGAVGDGEIDGHAVDETLDDGGDLAAQDGVDGAAHAGVAEEGGAAGEEALIGGLGVGVGADDGGNAAI